ncbi:MAG: hypothetical protein J7L03_03530 [Caldisericaceae bacterium]|nr:hypothetical protein [Caldisericaceae bacterium]
MKEIFVVALLIGAVSYFASDIVFNRRYGFVKYSGIELYIVGVLFSFVTDKNIISSLHIFVIVALTFIGFSFGIQFDRNTVKRITFKELSFAFLFSLTFFVIYLLLGLLGFNDNREVLSMILSMPSVSFLFAIGEKRFSVVSSEISIVFVLLFGSFLKFGFSTLVVFLLSPVFAFVLFFFEKALNKEEMNIILFALLLIESSLSASLGFDPLLSSWLFGFVFALLSNSQVFIKSFDALERPLFLSLLFFIGANFGSGFYELPKLLSLILPALVKPAFGGLLFHSNPLLFLPIGAMGIAVAAESNSSKIMTFTVISYFMFLFLSEVFRRKFLK